jgi:hypothetical protein
MIKDYNIYKALYFEKLEGYVLSEIHHAHSAFFIPGMNVIKKKVKKVTLFINKSSFLHVFSQNSRYLHIPNYLPKLKKGMYLGIPSIPNIVYRVYLNMYTLVSNKKTFLEVKA